jgi:hypothetical protein
MQMKLLKRIAIRPPRDLQDLAMRGTVVGAAHKIVPSTESSPVLSPQRRSLRH